MGGILLVITKITTKLETTFPQKIEGLVTDILKIVLQQPNGGKKSAIFFEIINYLKDKVQA